MYLYLIHIDLVFSSILFFSIFSFVHCGIWAPTTPAKERVCKTDTCRKRGNEYFENLNPAVHPCDDFYSFVCGVWYTQNKPPQYLAEWTTYDVMEKNLIKDFKEILDKPLTMFDAKFSQVKYFYDICMRQPFLGRLNPKHVAGHILKIGRFGSRNIWDIHEEYLKLTGESAFFEYRTHTFRPNDFTPLLFLREVDSAYGAVNHEAWKHEEVDNYSKFLFLLIKSLKLRVTEPVLKAKIKAVIQFRHKLNQIAATSKKRSLKRLKPVTAHDFEQRLKNPTQPKYSGMPWERIIKTLLSVVPKATHNLPITSSRENHYFADLEKLLASTPQEVLADHMEIYFAERHAVFSTQGEDLLDKTSIEPSNVRQPIRQDIPRYVKCIKGINTWIEVGQLLQQKWFRKDITVPVKSLVYEIKLAIASQVRESTWLNDETKVETIKRITDIQTWIGYPPWYNDPSTDKEYEAAENDPLLAEAYLDLRKFVIYIKSPILRPPVYDPDLPNVYNLGGIGYVIGHELYHTIYDCGYYSNARSPFKWWSTEMHDRCKRQMTCFIDSFNREAYREFELTYHQKIENKYAKTYLEDVPDVMGLDAAFRLYQVLKKKDPKTCQTLPRFERYSCEQMFFIAYANTMCGKLTPKAAQRKIQNSIHSINSVRVNAVMHNEDFQKAFQCPTGTPMNPAVKCNLWK